MFEDIIAKSGATVTMTGISYEEPDSSLAFNDFYVDGKNVGYIIISPSGMKNTVNVTDVNGMKYVKDFRTYIEAEKFMLSVL